jgi:hypothetical protein
MEFNKESNFFYLINNQSWGYDYTTLPNVKFTPETIRLSIVIHRRINSLEEIWQDYASLLNVNYDNKTDITTLRVSHLSAYPEIIKEQYYDGYGTLEFKIEKDIIDNVIPKVLSFLIKDKIIPCLNKFNDLKHIDKIFNSSLDPSQELFDYTINHDGFIFKRMVVAKLVGNPRYEEICNHIKSRFPAVLETAKQPGKEYYANYPIVFDTVYERLKDVKPLDNTELA